jgi:hypothetical protein
VLAVRVHLNRVSEAEAIGCAKTLHDSAAFAQVLRQRNQLSAVSVCGRENMNFVFVAASVVDDDDGQSILRNRINSSVELRSMVIARNDDTEAQILTSLQFDHC